MLELLIAILVGLCMTPGIALRYTPFQSMATPKKKRLLFIIYAAAGVCNVILMTVLFHIYGLEYASVYLQGGGTIFAVALSIVNMLVLRGKFKEHLFVLGMVTTCQYLMLAVPAYVISLHPEMSQLTQLLVLIGIYGGMLLAVHWLFARLLRNAIEPFLHLNTDQYFNTVLFIPAAYFVAIITFLWGSDTVHTVLQLVSGLLSGVIMVLICVSLAADHKRLYRHQQMERQLEGQKIHYAELRVRVERARKDKHDFKHHITAIRHYMDIDDKEGLRSYCDDLVERQNEHIIIPYTGNAAADGVLYHYMQRAQKEKVHFQYSGTIQSRGIADMDLCVLLGNALDNALAGCLTIPEGRSINVISQTDQQLLSIVVHNTFDGKVEQTEEGLLSRKRRNSHGVGLESMRSVCEQYGGSIDTQWNDRSFNLVILLPLT